MRRIRITPHIEYLEPYDKRKLYACSGLALNGRVKVVIDTNPGRDKTRDFLIGFNPDIAIVSHYHTDHSSWCSMVQEYTKAELMIPREEELYFRSFEHLMKNTVGGHSMEETFRNFALKHLNYREIGSYVPFDNPCSFIFGDMSLECIHTPGHSPGHTSFYLPGMKILFACDLGLDRIGPWYGWKDCSIEAIIESILSLRSMEIKLILTSHGGIIARDIVHSWDRALIHILNREQKIAQDLDMGKPLETIIKEGLCYPKKDKLREPIKSLFTMWDSVMLDHHMKILDKTSLLDLFPELRTIRMTYPQT